jgi:antitoxin CcdA
MNDSTPMRRRPTNVSLNPELVEEAKALGVNLSRACEAGLEAELKAERGRKWREENAASIASANHWVRENGLPLGRFRQF